jgi:predicted ATPase with chaperone activity
MSLLMEAGVAIRIGLRSGGSRNGVRADVSFAHHGVLFLGEITRREARILFRVRLTNDH